MARTSNNFLLFLSTLILPCTLHNTTKPSNNTSNNTIQPISTRAHWQDAYKLWHQRYEEAIKQYEDHVGVRPPQPSSGHRSSAFNFELPVVEKNTDFVYHVHGPGLKGSLIRLPMNYTELNNNNVVSSTPRISQQVFTPAWIHDLISSRGNVIIREPSLHAEALKCPRIKGDLTLTCSVRGPPEFLSNLTVLWKKVTSSGHTSRLKLLAENSSLRATDSRFTLERTKNTLKLRLWNFTLEDAGLYRCEGVNNDVLLTKDVNVRTCKVAF